MSERERERERERMRRVKNKQELTTTEGHMLSTDETAKLGAKANKSEMMLL